MAMDVRVGDAIIELAQGDITQQAVDAIVNAANSGLLGGGGVDGAIHRAGGPSILEACRRIVERQGRCPVGQAVITGAGGLKAKHVIHAVGPRYGSERGREAALLASAHAVSMTLADQAGCQSVAFPAISTGAYGYPVAGAAPIALGAVRDALKSGSKVRWVRFVLFDGATLRAFEAAAKQLEAR